MFLPSELINCINDFTYTDSYGISRKLVSDVEILNQSQGRFSIPDAPKEQWPQGLVISLIAAFLLALLFFVQEKFPAAGRAALGICYSLFGLLFGGAGLLLFFLSFFTSHDFAYNNENLFFFNPLLLASFPFGIKYAVTANYDKRFAGGLILRFLWFLAVLGIIVSMIVKLTPAFWQNDFHFQILMLPVALVLSLEPCGLKKIMQRIPLNRSTHGILSS